MALNEMSRQLTCQDEPDTPEQAATATSLESRLTSLWHRCQRLLLVADAVAVSGSLHGQRLLLARSRRCKYYLVHAELGLHACCGGT